MKLSFQISICSYIFAVVSFCSYLLEQDILKIAWWWIADKSVMLRSEWIIRLLYGFIQLLKWPDLYNIC